MREPRRKEANEVEVPFGSGVKSVTRRLMALALGALIGMACFLPRSASAEMTGIVFVDEDGDGAYGDGEPAKAGIVVSNGRTTTATAADGRYRLADGPDRVAFIVRPDDFEAAVWHRQGGGDFALRRIVIDGTE